jgi:hypothetical protein
MLSLPQASFGFEDPGGQKRGFSCLVARVFLGKMLWAKGVWESLVYLIAQTGVAQITDASPERALGGL